MAAVYASQAAWSKSEMVPNRRTSRYTKLEPSPIAARNTTYRLSSALSRRSYTIRAPVMRGWIIILSPDSNRSTTCLARRVTSATRLPPSTRSSVRGVTPRSTSVLRSRGFFRRRPVSRGAMPRTMVSTSGSSGTLYLSPPDIRPEDLAAEIHRVRQALACLESGGHVGSHSGGA